MDFLSDDLNQYITEEPKKKKGGAKKCEHGRQKAFCKLCGGSGLCKHLKNKYYYV